MLDAVPKILSYSARFQQDKITQQFSLFSLSKTEEDFLDEVEDFLPEEKAMLELDVLGLFSKYHYLDSYVSKFKDLGIANISSLSSSTNFGSGKIKIAGVILKKDARMSPRGRFITLLLSDPTGNSDVTIYSEKVMKDYSNLLSNKTAVVVECDSFRDEGGIRLTATSFLNFDEFIQSGFQNINLKISNQEDLNKVIEFIISKQDKSQETSIIYIDFKFKNYISKIKFSSNHKLSIRDLDFLNQFSIN